MSRLPISPRPAKKKQVTLRLSYACIDMLHYLKQMSGLSQEAIVERLIVMEAKDMEQSKAASAAGTGKKPSERKG